jgi:ABC-2 type transport system ATP-binding protein
MELKIQDLCKSYGKKKALWNFTTEFENGIYGILGPNGAGKSTLMNILTDNLLRDSGSVLYDGEEILNLGASYREIMGYMPQQQQLYDTFTVTHFISYMGTLKGMKSRDIQGRMDELLPLLNLQKVRKKKLKELSGGMKQRVLLLQALLNDPKFLILDEPTAGLDPKERVRFRNLISSLAENRIVILSTHIVSDVEYIANEILIMKNGELIQHGSPEEILKPIEKCVWECDVSRKEAEELELNYVTANLKHNNGAERLRIISQEAPCRTAWNVDPTLEDLYLYYFTEVSEHE